MTWKVQCKKAPIGDGAMVLLPQAVIDTFEWVPGKTWLRLVIDQDGHLKLERYHKRKGEGC